MQKKKKVLFICGSLNQTTMMHKVSEHLDDFEAYFTPFYADGILDSISRLGLLKFTILGGKHRKNSERYLADHHLELDDKGQNNEYDLVVSGTDTLVQRRAKQNRFILVQEGMIESETWIYPLVKHLHLPRWLANTATTGLSDAYDVFCVASPGYRDEFIRKGVKASKVIVTGIPNFDNDISFYRNDLPFHEFVLAASSPKRETFRYDDRKKFVQKVKEIANGRPVIFKLHPLENEKRARREILGIMPWAKVITEGNTGHLVANCKVLVTQTSSVTFTGLALGKEVYTDLDLVKLKKLLPVQNGGKSAGQIAAVCRRLVSIPRHQLKSPGHRINIHRELIGSDV